MKRAIIVLCILLLAGAATFGVLAYREVERQGERLEAAFAQQRSEAAQALAAHREQFLADQAWLAESGLWPTASAEVPAERDAAGLLNPALSWTGPLSEDEGAATSALLTLPEPVRQALDQPALWQERELTWLEDEEAQQMIRALDTGWMAKLSEFDRWSLEREGPMAAVLSRPDAELDVTETALPSYIVLRHWVQVRVYQALLAEDAAEGEDAADGEDTADGEDAAGDGDAAEGEGGEEVAADDSAAEAAAAEIRQLVRLMFSTEETISAIFATALVAYVHDIAEKADQPALRIVTSADELARLQRVVRATAMLLQPSLGPEYRELFAAMPIGHCLALGDAVVAGIAQFEPVLRHAIPEYIDRVSEVLAAHDECRVPLLRRVWDNEDWLRARMGGRELFEREGIGGDEGGELGEVEAGGDVFAVAESEWVSKRVAWILLSTAAVDPWAGYRPEPAAP
ncbi:hypothetical protein [Haliangium ochraceum]|uniref:Uncharacterized protein n=1 Tax=Haliangium ochraceum (strain DSM 14365 / JCM 11303 / SMP-2) TaxID=502025 RepID=D0LZQ7_HALO1|nr:hypothetical protein [Haliangium ochraceum]ACY18036.1 hypothetical protein Hoch_5554 [Haliangium ochraceum DSM 14365]